MGHTVNPISYRLYNSRYWSNVWFSSKNYSYLSIQDILIINFLKKFILSYAKISSGAMFNSIGIIRQYKNININIYLHDSFFDFHIFTLGRNYLLTKLKKKVLGNLGFILKRKRRRVFDYLLKKFLGDIKNLIVFFIKNRILRNYWNMFKSLSISCIRKFTFTKNINIRIICISKYNVNANIIGQFFSIRLQQYYTVWEIFKNINVLFKKLLFNQKILKGYKIIFSGRFSRKQRTTYSWKNFGALSPGTVKSKLDYANMIIPLRYSLCSVKVWICLKNKNSNAVDFTI